MAGKIFSHRDLVVWQKAVSFVDRVYDMTEAFPKHELYGLSSQVRRASVSVPSNIAEGNGRGTTQDYIRSLNTSYGSLMEVDTQMHVAMRRSYITANDEAGLTEQLSEIARMLNGLISSLERRKQSRDQSRNS